MTPREDGLEQPCLKVSDFDNVIVWLIGWLVGWLAGWLVVWLGFWGMDVFDLFCFRCCLFACLFVTAVIDEDGHGKPERGSQRNQHYTSGIAESDPKKTHEDTSHI